MSPSVPRRRKDDRPSEIAAAALELFVDKGFAATKLDDVAARAGVSKGTIYLYFSSKEELFKVAIAQSMGPMVDAAETMADEAGKPAADLLREFVFGWLGMVGGSSVAGVPKLMVAESGTFPEVVDWFHENIIGRAHRAMARLIERGIARGEFRPMDPVVAARIVFAPMFSYLIWSTSFGPCMRDLPAPDVFFNQTLDILKHGLSMPETAP